MSKHTQQTLVLIGERLRKLRKEKGYTNYLHLTIILQKHSMVDMKMEKS
jgi:predicted DNA-binding helix-hairpin-helix protein